MVYVLILRNADTCDINTLADAEQLIFGEGWNSAMFNDELTTEGGYVIIAENNNILCGYASVRIIADFAELLKIAVLPQYRRSGIAQKLFDNAVEFCSKSGIPSLLLEVREDNTPARTFYEKNGFTQTGLRKNYYGNCSAVLMEKAL